MSGAREAEKPGRAQQYGSASAAGHEFGHECESGRAARTVPPQAGNPHSRLVLASASPRRQELIRCLRVPFVVCARDTDESVEPGMRPEDMVERLALRKAIAVRDAGMAAACGAGPDDVIVGADTVVALGATVLGKPVDRSDAKAMLTALQGREHEVFTGVAVVHMTNGRVQTAHRRTTVRMKPLTERQIDRYIATGEPDDKAGAYAIQGMGALFIDGIEGCYFNVVGLPLSLLGDMLADFGIEALQESK